MSTEKRKKDFRDRSLTMDIKNQHDVELIKRGAEARRWIEQVLGRELGDVDFGDAIKDGVVLCQVIQKLQPDLIKRYNDTKNSKMSIKAIENIEFFLGACKKLGINDALLFTPTDLYEGKSYLRVVRCIHALSLRVKDLGLKVESIEGSSEWVQSAGKQEAKDTEQKKEEQKSSSSSSSDTSSESEEDKEKKDKETAVSAKPEPTKKSSSSSSSSGSSSSSEESEKEETKPEDDTKAAEPKQEEKDKSSSSDESSSSEDEHQTSVQPEKPTEKEKSESSSSTSSSEEEIAKEQPKEVKKAKESSSEESSSESSDEEEKRKQKLIQMIDEIGKRIIAQRERRESLEGLIKSLKIDIMELQQPQQDQGIKSGFLEKKAALNKQWEKQFFVLSANHELKYYDSPTDTEPKGVISLVDAIIYAHVEKRQIPRPLLFNIRTPQRDYLLRAAKKPEKDEWTKLLKANVKTENPRKISSTGEGFLGKTIEERKAEQGKKLAEEKKKEVATGEKKTEQKPEREGEEEKKHHRKKHHSSKSGHKSKHRHSSQSKHSSDDKKKEKKRRSKSHRSKSKSKSKSEDKNRKKKEEEKKTEKKSDDSSSESEKEKQEEKKQPKKQESAKAESPRKADTSPKTKKKEESSSSEPESEEEEQKKKEKSEESSASSDESSA